MEEKMLTASTVAMRVGVSVKTLNNWYKWFEDNSIEKPEDFPALPTFTQAYERGPRYWTDKDVTRLKKFKEWLPHGRNGVMGTVSSKYWSKKTTKNKETTEK